MRTLRLLTVCCLVSGAPQVGAETLNFTGTFDGYTLVGIAVPLFGVDTTLTSWPAYDINLTDGGIQELSFDVSGTITIEGGQVTAAVINQVSPLVVDTAGGTGYTRSTYNGISWTYAGGTTMGLTPGNGANVTGTCATIVPAGSGQCALQLTNLQTGAADSIWQWVGIAPNFAVSDIFGGSSLFFVNVGGAAGHPGVSWTVNGNDVTAVVTRGLDGVSGGTPNATFNSTYQGRFNLQTVAGAAAVDDGPIAALAATPILIDVLGNDTGFVDPVTVTVADQPGKGTASVTDSPGPQAGIRIEYTANVGASGADAFTYTVDDGTATGTATVTINITDAGAGDDTASTTRNAPVIINVGANDLGFGDAVTVSINGASFTAGGSATVTAGQGGPADGIRVTYTPQSAPGTPTYIETFTYELDDGVLPAATATVTVTVTNTVPVAVGGTIASIATVGVDPATRSGTFTAPGAGGSLGDAGAVAVNGAPARGAATVAGATITYQPAGTFFSGEDSFVYTITDADGEQSSATVTVVIANAVPQIPDSRIRTSQDTTSGPLNPGVTSGNGSLAQHVLAVATQAQFGTCTATTGTAAGRITYTPRAGYFGDDSCVLTVTDGDGSTDTATVSITVDQRINATFSGGSSAVDPWLLTALAGLLFRRRQGSTALTRG
jgi:hypothetical protein